MLKETPQLRKHLYTQGPDFKSWSKIGGAAQMCSYLYPTY
jgi:hypothetical protein